MSASYRFRPFRLDTGAFRLFRDDAPVALAPKGLDLLALLVARPGLLVSKDEIMRALWADVAVTDNALTQVVSDLRQALGDDPAEPRFIQTVARRGYRFIAPVEAVAQEAALEAPPRENLSSPRTGVRETSSLEAFRAFTEGRLKLERMDAADVPAAIADFERAIALEPRYAPAYVGLAHARFWTFEASRARNRPDAGTLMAAVADAHRAIDLDPDLAEAHAALALMLTAASRTVEAVAAGRRAVALEPGSWRNHCRLGVAAWGDERIASFERVRDLYPAFAYAYYGIAMVRVARQDLARAEDILRKGIPHQDREDGASERFPGRGLHWLLGLIRLAAGDIEDARAEFDRELASSGGGVYEAEFRMDACDGHGFAALAAGDLEGAAAMFSRALEAFPDHARSLLGLAAVYQRKGLTAERDATVAHASKAIEELHSGGRAAEAGLATAFSHVIAGRPDPAAAVLRDVLAAAPPGFAGWTIPIEPFLAPLRGRAGFDAVLGRLADRAR